MSLQNIFYTRDSVLELGHVKNVTIFLIETAASGWGSRSSVMRITHVVRTTHVVPTAHIVPVLCPLLVC